MENNPKVVFFDMGNTLLHFHFGKSDEEKDAAGIEYLTNFLRQFNQHIQYEDVRNHFFVPWKRGIAARRTFYTEYPVEEYLNAFLKRYAVELDLTMCIKAMDCFYTEYRNNVWMEDDLPQTLAKIRQKGYGIVVISNASLHDEVMIHCFTKVGIHKYIDTFTFSYYLKIAKPRKGIFETAWAKMAVEAKEVTMVGDSLVSDIKPAQELGWTGMWFNKDAMLNTTDIRPNAEIQTLSELLELL